MLIFDQPAAAAGARQAIAAAGQTGRCEAAGGDFFVAVPTGGDAYLLHARDNERYADAWKAFRLCR